MATYTKLSIYATEEQGEIISAYLADFPFESFEHVGEILNAYIPQSAFEEHSSEIEEMLHNEGFLDFFYEDIESQNWNAVWESHFEEVDVDGRVLIRAPFHKARPKYTGMEVIIQPKMSFGTGHHATTRLMVERLLEMDIAERSVLDMGSGTGVLAIVAAKLGAKEVLAVEIDDMAEESVRENIDLNGVAHCIESVCGDAKAIEGHHFDVVLANINRNILLADMEAYASTLSVGGKLVLSGFFEEDIAILTRKARRLGFDKGVQFGCNEWRALSFTKMKSLA